MKWYSLLGLLLTISPAISFAPSTITPKVKLDRSPENRLLVWSLVGENYGTSSQREIEGEDAPITFFLPAWRSVPGGDYIATATVYDSVGKVLHTASKQIHVEPQGHND